MLFGAYVPAPPLHTAVPFVADPDKVYVSTEQILPSVPAADTGTCAALLLIVITITSLVIDDKQVPATFPVTVNVKLAVPANFSEELGV